MDDRILEVYLTDGTEVAQVSRDGEGFSISTSDADARAAIEQLIERGRGVGLVHNHDFRQRTNTGQVFRMYGRWSKPGDSDFLDALADALVEFNYLAYTVELV